MANEVLVVTISVVQANVEALDAEQDYQNARGKADQALSAWEVAATGGSCCGWVKISDEGANPAGMSSSCIPSMRVGVAVSTERCCTSENCTDSGQRLAHKECNYAK